MRFKNPYVTSSFDKFVGKAICRFTYDKFWPIVAKFEGDKVRGNGDRVALTRTMVFARDRHVCAYCGGRFSAASLEMEHVTPSSRGGATAWQNVVAACRACNQRKGNRTPEAAGMRLLYVPYVPNRHESFILANRRILSDQMAFLLAGVPRHSRLWQSDDGPDAPASADGRSPGR